MSAFARALTVAVVGLVAFQFLHLGVLTLLLAINLSLAHNAGGLVAALASAMFLWVGISSLRMLRRMPGPPPLV